MSQDIVPQNAPMPAEVSDEMIEFISDLETNGGRVLNDTMSAAYKLMVNSYGLGLVSLKNALAVALVNNPKPTMGDLIKIACNISDTQSEHEINIAWAKLTYYFHPDYLLVFPNDSMRDAFKAVFGTVRQFSLLADAPNHLPFEQKRFLTEYRYQLNQKGSKWVTDPYVCDQFRNKPPRHHIVWLGEYAETENVLCEAAVRWWEQKHAEVNNGH